MDDRKPYTATPIPRREKQPENGAISAGAGDSTLDAQLSHIGAQFAEFEYEPDIRHSPAAEQALRFFSAVTPPQAIVQKAADPIREKFYEMRGLAAARPFARDDSELFYRQAKFMEDFTDDYKGDAKFFMYYPYYQHMSYDQLRTYFTWRAKARNGEILPTSESYAFLYVYELLSGIGVDDAADGLDKLVKIWDGFIKYGPALEKYMAKWFKDYHIFYELPHGFTDFIKEHNMQEYFSLTLIFDPETENNFNLWNSISTYDVTQSKFYNDGNQMLFQDCFDAVLRGISEFCDSCGKSFEELFIYRISNAITWKPFNHALFYSRKRQPDRKVVMPGKERYYCKNDRWSANLPIYYSNHKDYAGYILKKTESCLRQALKYKYKLTAELALRKGYYKELAVTETELDGVIEKSVADFHRDVNRTVVTVDHINLARIRKEALGTQEALIVREDANGASATDSHMHIALLQGATSSLQLEDRGDAQSDQEPPSGQRSFFSPPPIPCINGAGAVEDDEDCWVSLKEAFTGTELEALSMALNGGADIKSFADKNGIMLEVLVDGINEKSSDYIGDSIVDVDDGISIYEEYKENIMEMVGQI